MFVATLNKTLKSYLFAILGAEYILRWLPSGTHEWEKFVKPDDLINILKKNGLMFVATINKTFKSYMFAIVGAEYVLRWLPIGTHEWEKFVKPEELKKILTKNNLSLKKFDGMHFNIIKDEWSITKDLSVNYIAKFLKN